MIKPNLPDIQIKRVYDPPSPDDGYRVLVDRLWPRGLKKEIAALNEWLPDIAPSHRLRKECGHIAERFDAFAEAYRQELADNQQLALQLRERAEAGRLTLLYGARDSEHNQAIVLQKYLKEMK